VSDNPRVEELRRRVQADPTSIAFAALAEEYRRAGRYDEAIEVCRNGLNRHPAYLSARVTLGRALIELNQLDEAKMELDQVLSIAPENLAAIRALGEVNERIGQAAAAVPIAPPVTAHAPGTFELDLMPSRAPAVRHEPTAPDASTHGAALVALNQFLHAVLERKSHSA
jgi:tetratricopeptide (TPR) repeat protein